MASTKKNSPAAVNRKAAVRKQIQNELKALQRMEQVFVKARTTAQENASALGVDTFKQIEQVINQLGTAITVVDSATQDNAHRLAQTYLGK